MRFSGRQRRALLCGGALAGALLLWHPGAAADPKAAVLLEEEFVSLERWKPLTFPKIERHSSYEAVTLDGGTTALRAVSERAASGLVHVTEFDPNRYPLVQWRWRVDETAEGIDTTKRAGDDYPLRVFVLFPYDPQRAGTLERLQFSSLKALYGDYPPAATLNYVWGGRAEAPAELDSPYTERAKLFLLRRGSPDRGEWMEESVDIARDYRKAFKGQPPARALLAVMSDTDNSKSRAVAYLDYIRVRSADNAQR